MHMFSTGHLSSHQNATSTIEVSIQSIFFVEIYRLSFQASACVLHVLRILKFTYVFVYKYVKEQL